MWRSDGTEAGTVLAADIAPGSDSSNPEWLVARDGNLFFQGETATSGRELWRSGGTPGTTSLVKDIYPGAAGSDPHSLVLLQGSLYFSADSPAGRALWRSNGLAPGTQPVPASDSGVPVYAPEELTALDGRLFFSGVDEAGREVWYLDPQEGQTGRLLDVFDGHYSSAPAAFALANERLFFGANRPVAAADREWWAIYMGLDLGVDQRVLASQAQDVTPGQVMTYTISFGNNGLTAAAGVSMTTTLSAELASVTVQVVGGVPVTPTVGASTISWAIGQLAPGQGGELAVSGIVDGSLGSGATFNSTTTIGGAGADLFLANNSSTATATANEAPHFMLDPLPVAVTAGAAWQLTGSFSDVEPGDIHVARVEWGDGRVSEFVVDAGSGAISAEHVYAAAGVYDVNVHVIDSAGGMAEANGRVLAFTHRVYLPAVRTEN